MTGWENPPLWEDAIGDLARAWEAAANQPLEPFVPVMPPTEQEKLLEAVNVPRALPVSWDGIPMEWREWHAENQITICPPIPREPCPHCGFDDAPRSMCRGVRVGSKLLGPLFAFRCQACGGDTVHDLQAGDTWILELDDYGPEGSNNVRLTD
ncbi:hypothetical protein SEA_COLUCCI_66 [Arthrobacter phage Colucci]|uniref:Uncharacterized protein n=1 Tax=Arthrobacter phage Colucci TaxID=2015834 RepID=A0A286N2X8_9CAUD|nr:hypothetical protein FDI27_gp066 [Arthrobacter phage Colucci]ASX98735.1 hypothetical protein SEA_COLUCCI_66 [Arthrobacter phage Colucci]